MLETVGEISGEICVSAPSISRFPNMLKIMDLLDLLS